MDPPDLVTRAFGHSKGKKNQFTRLSPCHFFPRQSTVGTPFPNDAGKLPQNGKAGSSPENEASPAIPWTDGARPGFPILQRGLRCMQMSLPVNALRYQFILSPPKASAPHIGAFDVSSSKPDRKRDSPAEDAPPVQIFLLAVQAQRAPVSKPALQRHTQA
jgi:hypothetical protein